ncbi:MAG: YidC/Oxa1 family membrane protein insertase [Saprospiraceae bacterium]|jgi:YidC/Oxa1 family membrane protein insertase
MDRKQLIGMALIFLILMMWSYLNQPTPEEIEEAKRQKAQIEQVESKTEEEVIEMPVEAPVLDSAIVAANASQYGIWAPVLSGQSEKSTLSNDLIEVTLDSKGGRISKVALKKYEKHSYNDLEELIKTEPVLLLEDEKNRWNYTFASGALNINTQELFFSKKTSSDKVVYRATTTSGGYIEQTYSLAPDSYEIEYAINFHGLGNSIRQNGIQLDFANYMDKIEKNDEYERRFSTVYFKEVDEDSDYCTCASDSKEEVEGQVEWASFSNQFFNTSIIAKDRSFNGLVAENIVFDESNEDLKLTKAVFDIPFDGGSSETFTMDFFVGPNEFKMLKAYDNGLEQIIPFGRSIFGTINRYLVRPAFNFLAGFIGSKGVVIIILIFIIKMALYPLTYKMLHSQAKMGVLKPRLAGLKEKFKEEPQKIQVETMKIYREYGVSPFGGCMPMIVQMPIWYALFRFFPASITFRQEPFLWATDLSSYDVLFNIPWDIPTFGSHLSLFTILWAITTVIYTYYNSQHMDMSAQPAMKYVQYLMPLMFFAFFNKYASGLTCYMFFSQLFTIAQTVITKKFVFDDSKLLAQLDVQKAKPKKKNSFMQKLAEAQERQQQGQNKNTKKPKK